MLTMPEMAAYQHANPRPHTHLSASAYNGCDRQAWYKQNDYPPTDPVSEDAAALGTIIHLGWAIVMERAGWATEVPVLAPDGRYIGTADAIRHDPTTGEALEVRDLKTKGQAAYANIYARGIIDDPTRHQLNLLAAHTHAPTISATYLDRDTGHSFTVTEPADHAMGLADRIILEERQTTITHATHPDQVPATGTAPDTFPCTWCPFTQACWDDWDGTARSTDPERIAAAQEYATARAQKQDAERALATARDRLAGHPGTYGNWTVTFSKPGTTTRPDIEAITQILETHGYPLPTTDTPRKPTITVKPTPQPAYTQET